MNKFFVTAISVLAAATAMSAANAADMAAKAPTYKAAPAQLGYSWSGFYVGGLAGYGWGTGTHCDTNCIGVPNVDPKGWNAGVTLGHNWQLANWVLGVEGDWSWANMKGSSPNIPGFGCLGSCGTKIKSFETIRGRVGYAFDRFLPYLTAGVAFTQLEGSIGSPVQSSGSTTKSSFTAGGGVEYGFLPNWSAKLEYLYVSKLGNFIYDSIPVCSVGCSVSNVHYNEVRLGVNYRFSGL